VAGLLLESSDDQPFILGVYDEDGELVADTDPDTIVGFEGLEVSSDVTFILEVATEDDASGGEYTLTIEDQS
jgi:hypothetical protein